MDKKDEKILTELILNSRIPFNQLGKKVGVSREVAAYRVKRLVDEKIILDFYPIIDVEALGFTRNGCCIQLKGIDNKKEREFFNFLKNHPFVTFAGSIVGKWNIAFDILSRNRAHLAEIIKEIITEAEPYIESYIVTNSTADQEIFPTKMIGVMSNKAIHLKNKIDKVDEINKKILTILSTNSRIEYIELASKLNLSANAIKYRIKNLKKAGVIISYTISINQYKLGYEFYNIQIKLNQGTNEAQLKNFLRSNPRVVYFYRYFGHENWDIDVGVIAKNSFELREVIMDFRKELKEMMKIYDIYSTLEVIKSDIAPKGVFY